MKRFALALLALVGMAGAASAQQNTTILCRASTAAPTYAEGQIAPCSVDLTGKLRTVGGATGDVVGPASSTDNAIVRFDSTTGKLIQNSVGILSDTGVLTGITNATIATGTITASAPYNFTQTWNNGAVTFRGVENTYTITAAASGSTVERWLGGAAGTTVLASIGSTGAFSLPAVGLSLGSVFAGTIAGTGTMYIDIPSGFAGHLSYNATNVDVAEWTTGKFALAADVVLGWSSTANNSAAALDTILARDAANTLALRNGTAGQTARIYGSFTDASNGDWLSLTKAAGGTATIATTIQGTGAGVNIVFAPGGTTILTMASNQTIFSANNSTIRFDGAVIFNPDNTLDIGASGATRPRNLYVAGLVTAGSATLTGSGGLLSRGVTVAVNSSLNTGVNLLSPADGIARLSNFADTDFSRLQFGGTTSSFPALARNGIKLEAKLADDSTYASIASSGLIVAGAVPTLVLAGGTCAGTAIAGGSTAGTVTLTGVCVATNTLTLSVMPTAPTGYACDATDRTLGTVALGQTGTSTTTAVFTFLATTGGTDVISYKCIAY